MNDLITRRGKIARLPSPIREQLNQRLQSGGEGKKLVEWLNSLPKSIAALKEELAFSVRSAFEGNPFAFPMTN